MLYRYIIVGTGQATGTLLGKLIQTGESIAVIEESEVGGSCVNYGCTPTKTLVASARAIHLAKQGNFYGFNSGKVVPDYSRIRERMNEVRHNSRDGLETWMKETKNVDLIYGRATFISDKALKVGKEIIEGEYIFINAGTRPSVPPIEGLKDVNWLDSAQLLEKTILPDHLIIIGGGYIGVEFAQIYRRSGSKVTIVQNGNQLIPREDQDVAEAVANILMDEGVTIHCDTKVKKVRQEKEVVLTLEKSGDIIEIHGSDLLIATGRTPNSDTLQLESAGIQTDERGFILVDDHCQTSVNGVYALGDINGMGAFTHTAVNDAEIVINQLFGDASRGISKRNTVYALFSDPPLGRVGLTEKEAVALGKKILKATRPMSEISRAKEMGETRGFAKLLVDGETDRIIGASVLGIGGDEVINMFAAIIHSDIPCREYRKVVLVHPTVSELMPWILDDLG